MVPYPLQPQAPRTPLASWFRSQFPVVPSSLMVTGPIQPHGPRPLVPVPFSLIRSSPVQSHNLGGRPRSLAAPWFLVPSSLLRLGSLPASKSPYITPTTSLFIVSCNHMGPSSLNALMVSGLLQLPSPMVNSPLFHSSLVHAM